MYLCDIMVYRECIEKVETDRVHYDADTIGGQSGSPVYIKKMEDYIL